MARTAAVGLSGQPSIDVRRDFATTRDVDLSFAMSSSFDAWEPALSILTIVSDDAATLPTHFALDDWETAFQAVEQRTVVKAVIDPTWPRDMSHEPDRHHRLRPSEHRAGTVHLPPAGHEVVVADCRSAEDVIAAGQGRWRCWLKTRPS